MKVSEAGRKGETENKRGKGREGKGKEEEKQKKAWDVREGEKLPKQISLATG